jgi:acyl-CoA synthetase (AMP-forming)/AMP-acid ligase II/pimeloyl-ACP methyl ester carboxylesterase
MFFVDHALYPFSPKSYTQRQGHKLHYIDEGDGEAVVMVHGNPSWSFYFRNLIHALRPTHRVIAMDHIGCGLSDIPPANRYNYTLAQRLEDLTGLLERLRLGDGITLILHDWGGMIGMAYALQHLPKIKRIVLMNTAAFGLPTLKPFPSELALARSALGTLLVRGLNAFSKVAVKRCVSKAMPPEIAAMYLEPYDTWQHRVGVHQFVRDIPLQASDPAYAIVHGVEEALPRFRDIPTLIAWGSRDFVFDDLFLSRWRESLPQAEVLRFPDAGHFVLEDEPEAICTAVQRFLGVSTASTRKTHSTEKKSANEESFEMQYTAPFALWGIANEKKRETAQKPTGEAAEKTALFDENIADALVDVASRHPSMLALAVPQGREKTGAIRYKRITYAELNKQSDILARGLLRAGFQPGMRCVLMVPPSEEFFALVFALFKAGIVPVVVDPGMGLHSLKRCLDDARPEGFIGIPKAHIARRMLGWGKASIRHLVNVGGKGDRKHHALETIQIAGEEGAPLLYRPQQGETAAVLFTSGSTGIPKGAIYTHANFQAQIRAIRSMYAIQEGERDLCTFPLFALFAPALGMSAYIPEMDASRPARADARKIIQAIQEQEITNLFGSPALLRVLARHNQQHPTSLPSLRRVISAGAPMPPSLLEAFQPMLAEGVEVFPGYGATEAMPLCTLGSKTTLKETRKRNEEGGGVCVGQPNEMISLRIIPIHDEPIAAWSEDLALPPHQIGEIVVKGEMVTRAYLHQSEGTRLAKIPDGEDVWHRMGDLGYLDEKGRLWFCGRKSHRVETAKGTLYSLPCEAIFQRHPKVARAALIGLGQRPHQHPVICIEPHDPADTRDQRWLNLQHDLKELAKKSPLTRDIQFILPHPAFPVDIRHNSKIFVEKLRDWAVSLLSPLGTE